MVLIKAWYSELVEHKMLKILLLSAVSVKSVSLTMKDYGCSDQMMAHIKEQAVN